MTEVLTIEVAFALPDWFAEERYQTMDSNGDYLGWDSDDERALFEAFPEQTETCVAPESKWVTLAFPVDAYVSIGPVIDAKRLQLDAFLNKIKGDR